ncbi:MAG: heparinase II/III family protein [Planctomycetes bacterium]|nr:heparinase II/III family protein [Planctomycetota bacterium]
MTQRLYIGPEHYARLTAPGRSPALSGAQDRTLARADAALADPSCSVDETGHNWHLIRGRLCLRNVLSLLVAFRLTGLRRYRDGVVDHIERMGAWEQWSWISWKQGTLDRCAIFDLSYGENSTTLAIAYDGLRDELTADERARFIEIARSRSFAPYLARNGGESTSWYYTFPLSNWNTVCNGGAGMLALAIGADAPESERVLALVEIGIAPFFTGMNADGAWPEGIGYWNYGMQWGFQYLLSHERATGRRHPLLERASTAATLDFPLLFTPNGVPCSFGDVNSFVPMPFHYAAAERYGRWDLVAELDQRIPAGGLADTQRAVDAELLLLHPGTPTAPPTARPDIALMDGLEWGYVADRMPNPRLYASVRGGTTKVPHAHDDLLSFFVTVGNERLIDNVPVNDYYDTTFGKRRFELYETSSASKNTVFVNGVGILRDAAVTTTIVRGDGWRGFHLDATAAMGLDPAAGSCIRMLLLVEGEGLVVIDRVELAHPGLFESRLHTFSRVEGGSPEDQPLAAWVRGATASLHLSFVASCPSQLKRGLGLQNQPAVAPDTILRHVVTSRIRTATMCCLLSPERSGTISVDDDGSTVIVGRYRLRIGKNSDL